MSGGLRWSLVVNGFGLYHRISPALGAGMRGLGGHVGYVGRGWPHYSLPSSSTNSFPLYRGVLDHQGAATRPVARLRGGGHLLGRRPPVTTRRPAARGCAVVNFSGLTTKVTTTAPDKAMSKWRGRV